MRRCAPFIVGAGVLLAGTLVISCSQEPYTLAPRTEAHAWRTVHAVDDGPSYDDALTGVWANASDDIWTVGELNRAYHFDGYAWTEHEPAPGAIYADIQGDSEGSVYVATSAGVYRHADGAWEKIGPRAHALWVLAPDDVLALQSNALLRFDGDGWITLADVVSPSFVPIDVWGSSASDVYMAAREGLLHFDGAGVTVAVPEENSIRRVWGSGPADVYAAGGGGLHHFDGAAWQTVPATTGREMGPVWGGGPGEVYATDNNDGILFHFDGTRWEVIWFPFHITPLAGFASDATGLIVCDWYGNLLVRRDGRWAVLRGAEPRRIRAVWPVADGSVIAAYNWAGRDSRVTRYHDGAWNEMPPAPVYDIVAIWGTAGDLHAVTNRALTAHFDGESWGPVRGMYPSPWFEDVWVGASEEVVAGGSGVYRFDGDVWARADAPDTGWVTAVSCDGAGTIMAVTTEGEVVAYDGSDWSVTRVDWRMMFRDVWVASSDFAVAVGRLGSAATEVIYQYDGGRWEFAPMGRGWDASRVIGRSRDEAYVVGSDRLYYFNGRYWSEAGTGPFLSDLVAANGRILGWSPLVIVELNGL